MPNEFVQAARSFLGARFKHVGRHATEMDCAGHLLLSARKCGRELVDLRTYKREPYKGQIRAHLEAQLGPPIPRDQVQPGCVGLFNTKAHPHHIGIFGDHPEGGLSLIHASGEEKMVVEARFTGVADLEARLVDVFRSPV